MFRRLQRLLTQFDDALDWLEDDPLLSAAEPTVPWGAPIPPPVAEAGATA